MKARNGNPLDRSPPVTLIETSSFMKAVHRQVPARDDEGHLFWRTRPTGPQDDLTDRLRAIIAETRATGAPKSGSTDGR